MTANFMTQHSRGPEGPRSKFAAAFAILVLTACSPTPSREEACTAPAEERVVAQMYFGRNIGGALGVSETQWQAFVDREITPRFPDGLTITDAQGQWRDSETGAIVHEPSKALTVFLGDEAQGRAALDAIAEAMKAEYEGIVEAGFYLQIDAPDLAMGRHIMYRDEPDEVFVERAAVHVDAINQALRDVPGDRGDRRIGLVIGPDRVVDGRARRGDAVIACIPLVRAVRVGGGATQRGRVDVADRDVLRYRISGFGQAECGTGVGDDFTVDPDLDTAAGRGDRDRMLGRGLPDLSCAHR